MKTLTVDSILALGPCKEYTRERITELLAGPNEWPVADVLRLETVPLEDRMWLVSRALDAQQLARWLELVITRAVTTHALHCGIPTVETWAREWLDGTNRSAAGAWRAETVARTAARAARAVGTTARAAAAAARAARAADIIAINGAAGFAAVAFEATMATATATAGSADRTTERELQLHDALKALEER